MNGGGTSIQTLSVYNAPTCLIGVHSDRPAFSPRGYNPEYSRGEIVD